MSNEQADKYGSRQLTELENLRAERDAYKQQAEFSAGEIKRLQLNAGIFEDVKAARDNAERDANALRAQLSMRSSIEPTTFDLKDTLHKVVNNLLEHGGEHYKRMFGRSGSCIFTNAEVGAIREVVFRALKAKLSATLSPPKGWRLVKDSTFAERSWKEDESHENGNYHCNCCDCGRTFQGHKRRVTCKVCAVTPCLSHDDIGHTR